MIPVKRSRGWKFVKSNLHGSKLCLIIKLVDLNARADRAHVIFTLLAKPFKWILAILGTKAASNDTCKAIERLKICQIKFSWIIFLFDHKARGTERPSWSRTRHFYSLSEAFTMNIGDFLGTKAALNDTCKAIERLRICHTKFSWIEFLFDHKARGSELPGWLRTRHFYSLSEAHKWRSINFEPKSSEGVKLAPAHFGPIPSPTTIPRRIHRISSDLRS